MADHSFLARLRPVTEFRTVPGFSTTPWSKLRTAPLRIVTSLCPLFITPTPRPVPWTVFPFRSTVIPLAPITRPSPAHPARLLVIVVFARMT